MLVKRSAGVVSERSSAEAERAALAHARCTLQPRPDEAEALRAALVGMRAKPPLPHALIAQSEGWLERCAGAVDALH